MLIFGVLCILFPFSIIFFRLLKSFSFFFLVFYSIFSAPHWWLNLWSLKIAQLIKFPLWLLPNFTNIHDTPHSISTTSLVSPLSCQSFRWCDALEIEPISDFRGLQLVWPLILIPFLYCSFWWRVNFNAARTWLGRKLGYLAMTVGRAAKAWWASAAVG